MISAKHTIKAPEDTLAPAVTTREIENALVAVKSLDTLYDVVIKYLDGNNTKEEVQKGLEQGHNGDHTVAASASAIDSYTLLAQHAEAGSNPHGKSARKGDAPRNHAPLCVKGKRGATLPSSPYWLSDLRRRVNSTMQNAL
jgi:hypothetical protein